MSGFGCGVPGLATPDLASEGGIVIHEPHLQPAFRRARGRGQTRGASTDYQHVELRSGQATHRF
jgi:hypothetical protein